MRVVALGGANWRRPWARPLWEATKKVSAIGFKRGLAMGPVCLSRATRDETEVMDNGLPPDIIQAKIEGNDLPNGRLVIAQSGQPSYRISGA